MKRITFMALLTVFIATSALATEFKETRYPSGKTHEQWTEEDDGDGAHVKHGRYTSWHENGQKKAEGRYRSDKKHGIWNEWYPNNPDGTDDETDAWYEKGSMAKEKNYSGGVLHGAYTEWHANTKKAEQGTYQNGRKHGTWYAWDEKGNLKAEAEYADGALLEQKAGPATNPATP